VKLINVDATSDTQVVTDVMDCAAFAAGSATLNHGDHAAHGGDADVTARAQAGRQGRFASAPTVGPRRAVGGFRLFAGHAGDAGL
jgi:hypothetical protein